MRGMRTVRIGTVDVGALGLAPMAGLTDRAMRAPCLDLGAGFAGAILVKWRRLDCLDQALDEERFAEKVVHT